MTDLNPRAVPGDNQPDPGTDPFIDRLEAENKEILDSVSDLELEAARLPKAPNSDEDVDACNTFARKVADLTKRAEARRVEAKKPYDEMSQKVQDFFMGIIGRDRSGRTPATGLKARRREVIDRCAPYLEAKAAAEQERRRQQAEEAARLAREQEAAAAAARAEAAELQRQADEAAERKRAEAARLAEAQEADRAGGIADELTAPAIGEAAAQAAGEQAELERRARIAAEAAEQADRDAAKLTKTAERQDKAATGPASRFAQTRGGGGTMNVQMVWQWRPARGHDMATAERAVREQLGPLGPLFSQAELDRVLSAAAKLDPRPTVNGVEFYQGAKGISR